MAQLLQRMSSSGSQQWAKNSRMNKPVAANDNKEPATLLSTIKEAASTLRETQLQISSVLSVQADIQERINYWQTELGKTDNPADGSDDPRQPSHTGNVAATHPCKNPEDVGESWIPYKYARPHLQFHFHYRIQIQLALQSVRVPLFIQRRLLDIVRRRMAAKERPNGFATGSQPKLASRC